MKWKATSYNYTSGGTDFQQLITYKDPDANKYYFWQFSPHVVNDCSVYYYDGSQNSQLFQLRTSRDIAFITTQSMQFEMGYSQKWFSIRFFDSNMHGMALDVNDKVLTHWLYDGSNWSVNWAKNMG